MLIEKIIPHPLKPIVLRYDDEKLEQEFEIDLLKEYIKLHDYIIRFYPERENLLNIFNELDQHVSLAKSAFEPIAEAIEAYHSRAKQLVAERTTSKMATNKLIADRDKLFEKITPFHENHIDKLGNEMAHYGTVREEYVMGYDAFHDDYMSFYKNRDIMIDKMEDLSLDKESFKKDYHLYSRHHSRDNIDGDDHTQTCNDIMDRYNDLMGIVGESYALWKELSTMTDTILLGEYLLDTSLSDSFKDILDAPGRPKYFLLPGDKVIYKNMDFLKKYCNLMTHTPNIHVLVAAVEAEEQSSFQEIVLALQHFPLLIEKSLFAFEFIFEEIAGSTLILQEDDWKSSETFMKWFHKMSVLPFLLFFIHDRDARNYFIMGDLLAEGKITGEVDENNPKRRKLMLEGEILEEIANRIFFACEGLLIYCHNTGFDPQPYIEGVIAEFDFGLTYEMILEEYQKKIDANYHFRVFIEKKKEE
ncbi:MAG: hypothetical protein WCL14_07775 [Bacteroidota bacterium]